MRQSKIVLCGEKWMSRIDILAVLSSKRYGTRFQQYEAAFEEDGERDEVEADAVQKKRSTT
jgi:hypothetical protein